MLTGTVIVGDGCGDGYGCSDSDDGDGYCFGDGYGCGTVLVASVVSVQDFKWNSEWDGHYKSGVKSGDSDNTMTSNQMLMAAQAMYSAMMQVQPAAGAPAATPPAAVAPAATPPAAGGSTLTPCQEQARLAAIAAAAADDEQDRD